MIVQGDCLTSIPNRDYALAYLDPPFFTQRMYGAFDDRWDNRDSYIEYISRRVAAAWKYVTPGGSLVLHVDWHASHYLKVELDRILGEHNFKSEIVWRYRRWPSKTPNFQRVHDVLLRYLKGGAEPIWNQLYEPLAESTRKQWGTGRQLAIIEGGKRKCSSTTSEPSPGVPMGDVWDIGIVAPSSPGVPMGDVWDIGIVAPSAYERTGYPTQKPERLIERLILALTFPGDCVLDPFCGSGTVAAVARRLGRDCVSIDTSNVAIEVANKRISNTDKPRISV